MIAKIASLAVLAIASTAFMPAIAAPVSLDIRVGPPAPRYEVVPAARAGYIWAPGYWDWRGNRYGWTQGNWVRERQGYIYTQPTWVNNGGRYHFYRGAWARGGGGDRDRDGVANRFDRDRDGDGIRNRNDRHPNNGHRR